jgi:hypothetical protein
VYRLTGGDADHSHQLQLASTRKDLVLGRRFMQCTHGPLRTTLPGANRYHQFKRYLNATDVVEDISAQWYILPDDIVSTHNHMLGGELRMLLRFRTAQTKRRPNGGYVLST